MNTLDPYIPDLRADAKEIGATSPTFVVFADRIIQETAGWIHEVDAAALEDGLPAGWCVGDRLSGNGTTIQEFIGTDYVLVVTYESARSIPGLPFPNYSEAATFEQRYAGGRVGAKVTLQDGGVGSSVQRPRSRELLQVYDLKMGGMLDRAVATVCVSTLQEILQPFSK